MPLSENIHQCVQKAIANFRLPEEFIDQVEEYYLPLAEHLDALAAKRDMPLCVSLQAPQGAGKSTLCHFIQLLLEQQFNHQIAVISLDDFYYPKSIRQQLAEEIHPLLQTRGVPGTHDLALAVTTIKQLKAAQQTSLPRFNKAEDDPFPRSQWPVSRPDTSIILFEGWCNQVPVQSDTELDEPVNELEADQDPDKVWRYYVNQQLANYHQQLFSLCDYLICIHIPDFELVFQWRGLQEQKLQQDNHQASGLMSQDQTVRFIQHFERLTRHAMKHLPQQSDILLSLDAHHRMTNLVINNPG